MPINPYESPRIPADEGFDDEPALAWPATGAFRYYQTLVWHPATRLPAICVRSGLPADSTTKLTLRSLIDDDGSIRPAFDLKPRLYDLVLPINAAACAKRPAHRWGWLSLLSGLLLGALAAVWPGRSLAFALPAAGTSLPGQDGLDVLIVSVCGIASVTLLAVGLRWLAGPLRIQLLCIDRGYLQLFGLHPTFLAALPEWPVPDRDSTGNSNS